MKRTFLALPVNATSAFIAVYKKFKNELAEEPIKWVSPEHLHLTMFFFGPTSEDMEFRIKKTMDTARGSLKVLNVRFNRIDAFPSEHNPRVIWAGVDHPEPFQELYDTLLNRLQGGDVALERNKKFIPHLTLGRPRWIRDRSHFRRLLKLYQSIPFPETRIDTITYFQSVLTPQGPIYKPLGIYPLKPEK